MDGWRGRGLNSRRVQPFERLVSIGTLCYNQQQSNWFSCWGFEREGLTGYNINEFLIYTEYCHIAILFNYIDHIIVILNNVEQYLIYCVQFIV